MAVILYGASLTYKSTICKAMKSNDPGNFISFSNSWISEVAREFYNENDLAEASKALLYGRCMVYEGLSTQERKNAWLDRGLLDQYTWCTLFESKGIPTPSQIKTIEEFYINKSEPLRRVLIINHDYELIADALNEERMRYLNVTSMDDFIKLCNRFNNLFMGLFPFVQVVEITNLRSQLLDDKGAFDKSKVFTTFQLDNTLV